MANTVKITLGGTAVEETLHGPRLFKTGSDGYFASFKLPIGKDRYQVSINVIRVGSKEANARVQVAAELPAEVLASPLLEGRTPKVTRLPATGSRK